MTKQYLTLTTCLKCIPFREGLVGWLDIQTVFLRIIMTTLNWMCYWSLMNQVTMWDHSIMKRQLLASRTALLFASQVHVLLRFLYCYLCVSKGEGFQKMNENIKTSFLNIEHKAMLVPKNSNEDLRKVKCYLSPRVSDYYRIVLLW